MGIGGGASAGDIILCLGTGLEKHVVWDIYIKHVSQFKAFSIMHEIWNAHKDREGLGSGIMAYITKAFGQ